MEEAGERLGRAWGVVGHLHSVFDVPEWREGLQRDAARRSRASMPRSGRTSRCSRSTRPLHDSPEFATLSPVRQRILEHALRDFRLSGAELPDAQKPRFQAIQEEQSQLAAKFSENLLDATNAHAEWITDESAPWVDPASRRRPPGRPRPRRGRGQGGWKFTLQMPSYLPVLRYADDRELRARMYRAYATRASGTRQPRTRQRPADRPHPRAAPRGGAHARLPQLRRGLAGAQDGRHAGAGARLPARPRRKGQPFAEKDLEELRAFAKAELGLDTLEPWDVAYASEKTAPGATPTPTRR